MGTACATSSVALADYKGWSLCGAPWLQPVATGSKRDGAENGSLKRKPLPSVATSCLSRSMARRSVTPASGRWPTTSPLRRRGSISLKRQVLRTRRPTGLDRATLTGERSLVKPNGALPSTTAGAMLGPSGTYPRPVQRRRSPARIRRCPATAMPRSGTSQVDRSAPKRA